MSLTGPSLGNITGTNLDSACKHIQQCKVSFDHMLFFTENADELEKEKMRFCAHKDEVIVGIGRPWKKAKVRNLPPCAYPRIVSNLGNITREDEKYKMPCKMITFLFHTATDVYTRSMLVNAMDQKDGFECVGPDLNPEESFFFIARDASRKPKFERTDKHLHCMFDYYPVGIGNTVAFANPRSGDTVGSVMIGGLRTVMNGDWEVHAGDLVQWYWTFEKECFDAEGKRKNFYEYNDDGSVKRNLMGMSPCKDANRHEGEFSHAKREGQSRCAHQDLPQGL
jgi:hypothetical protein